MSSLKVFGSITLVLGILSAILSVWLLASALMEDCAGSGYGYQFGNVNRYGYSDNRRVYGAQFGDYSRDRYDQRYSGSRQDYLRRDREYFCGELVAKWITAAAIGISVGVLQFSLSAVFLVRNLSKIMTIVWASGHLLFLAGMVAAFAVGFDGEVHDSREIEIVGKVFIGIMALNAAISFILPCIACWMAMSNKEGDHRGVVYKEQQTY